MSDGRALRVATWNIHGGIGTDGRLDVGRIADVVGELDADLVGLQEVDTGYRGGGDQLEELREATGMHAVAGPTLFNHAGHYGNALLSRRPPAEVRRHDLSFRRREPRGALDVDLDWDGHAVGFVVTHFGTSLRERVHQVRRLAEAIGPARASVLVVVGDFNEWRPMGATLRHLDATLGRSRGPRSFPSGRPLFRLDRIWVRPAACLTGLTAHRSPLSRVASDHLPVVATVDTGQLPP